MYWELTEVFITLINMKKSYNTPRLRIRYVKESDVIVTSDPQLTDDPSDDGKQLAKPTGRSNDWESYE